MKELKPCQNDKCPHYGLSGKIGTWCSGSTLKQCKLYQVEKTESAWEMFKRLEKEYRSEENLYFENNQFILKLQKKGWSDGTTISVFEVGQYFLVNYSEQEFIKLMQSIERELEG
jgi:hypothetical protein